MKKPRCSQPAPSQTPKGPRHLAVPPGELTPEILKRLGGKPLVMDIKSGPVRRVVKLR